MGCIHPVDRHALTHLPYPIDWHVARRAPSHRSRVEGPISKQGAGNLFNFGS